jgi:hypothetical protein
MIKKQVGSKRSPCYLFSVIGEYLFSTIVQLYSGHPKVNAKKMAAPTAFA